MSFVHLRNYSEYTMPEGVMKIDALVAQAAARGMEAVALTDRRTLSGAIEFDRACKNAGIKPIFGLEIDARLGLSSGMAHVVNLTLLAANHDGWRNLCVLSSQICCSEEPDAVTEKVLRDDSQGLICVLSSTEGAVSGALQAKQVDVVTEVVDALGRIFDDGRLFLSVQNHGGPEALAILPEAVRMARDTGVPLVATNKCLFASPEDAQPYSIVRALRSGRPLTDDYGQYAESFLKSGDEMDTMFTDLAEATENTGRIASQCDVDPTKAISAPPVDLPAEFDTADAYVRHLAREGLRVRIKDPSPVYEERLDHELSIIQSMNVSAYFLFVRKYVQLANRLGFLTSERGSSSASLVSYALGITTLDPIEWGLSFERFLNPALHWSSPDIDMDIEGEGRLRVMDALRAEFGDECVAHVGRFSRLSEKKALRAVAEALSYSQEEIHGFLYDLETGENTSPTDDRARLLHSAAALFAHTIEHDAIHPCGVVVAREQLNGVVPVRRVNGTERLITQPDMRSVDGMGLIKFDLIGSRNLSVLHATMDLIAARSGRRVDLQSIPLTDEETFALFQQGRTGGVFSFGTREMANRARDFQPTTIEDIVAFLALHHMRNEDEIAAYGRRKNGQEPCTYLHPSLEPILTSTYGLVLYQEQIQKIGREIGGLSLADADVFRRAFRNGRADILEEQRQRFLLGADAKGFESSIARKIFDFALDRSPYTFCRPHAAAYGKLAYQGAFLKVHHSLEYITSFFNTNPDQRWSIDSLLSDAEAMGVGVDPPDINRAQRECTIQNDRIRLGFTMLRHCPAPAVDAIVTEREQSGPFKDLFDVVRRLDAEVLTRRTLLGLISSGALDSLPGTMAQKFATADHALLSRADRSATLALPQRVDSFDLLREIASIHRHVARDLSFDIYCPKSYSHHFRFTMWLPPDSVIFEVDISQLIEQARLFAGYLESERNSDYAIGLNSRVNQYAEKHLLMLDLDSIDEPAIERLGDYGGYLLKSGRGYHFIGKTLISSRAEWEQTLRDLGRIPELKPHIDDSHIDMSLKRGYSTLRILESPAKPQRPMMIKLV